MSSELKRVALDFDWPLNKVWSGYLNDVEDTSVECDLCEGSGLSPFAQSLKDKWEGHAPFHPKETGSTPFTPTDEGMVEYVTRKINFDEETLEYYRKAHESFSAGLRHLFFDEYRSSVMQFEAKWGVKLDREVIDEIDPVVLTEAIRLCNMYNSRFSHHLDDADVEALLADGRLKDLTHDFAPGQGWTEKSPKVTPSARAVNLWSLSGFGHDGMNQHVVLRARCERAGEPMMCSRCDGDGEIQSEENRALRDAWEPTEPPAGEGYQLWETISDGAPISPVFETPEALAQWLHENLKRKGLTESEWLSVLQAGGAPVSMAMVDGKMMNGEQFVARGKA